MSARHIHSHKTSSSRLIKRSLMGSALAAGLASATLMGAQTAWAQSEAPAPQGAGAQNPIGGGSASQPAPALNSQQSAGAASAGANARANSKLHANSNAPAAERSVTNTSPTTSDPANSNNNSSNNNDDNTIIEIKDRDLKRLVYFCVTKAPYYDYDGVETWNLTKKDAEQLEELGTRGYGYGTSDKLDSDEGIALIKHFKNLKKLHVGGCSIKDPKKLLNALPKTLESLELGKASFFVQGGVQVSPIDSNALAGFTQLKHLSLSGITLNDTKFLSNMKALEELNLSDTGTHDLSPLSAHTKLKTLDISKNGLSDISALSALTNLSNLNISKNNIQSLNSLKKLNQLETLDASNNKITSIDALQELKKLKTLRLNHNKIATLGALAGHNALQTLDIASNCVKDVSPLASLVKNHTLTTIKGIWNNIRDVSPIYENLPAKIEGHTDGLRAGGSFSYDFDDQTIDAYYKDAGDLRAYGIKAGDSGITYTQDGSTITSESLNAYTGSASVLFYTNDSFRAYQRGIQLLHIAPISQTFNFSGAMRVYRYKPELSDSKPIEIDFGGKLPSIEEIKKRVSITNIKSLPTDGYYRLLAGTESAQYDESVDVNPFGGGIQTARVSIIYGKKDESDPNKRANYLDYIEVPVYVRTMAESYHPNTITLQTGKTLDKEAIEEACKALIPFNFIEKSEATEENGYSSALRDDSIDVWYKTDDDDSSDPQDDIDPKKVYCTKPVFSWGDFQSITASASDEGTTKDIPVTITYADHSVWKGKITISIPNKHTGGSGLPIPDDSGNNDGNNDHNGNPDGSPDGNPDGDHSDTHNPNEDPSHSHTGGTNGASDTNGSDQDDSGNDNTTTPHRRRGRHFARTHQAQGTSDIDAASTAASASAEGTNGTGSNGQDNAGTGTDAGKGVSGDANADANASSSADTKRSGTNSNDAKEASAHSFFDQLAAWLSEHANFLALVIVLLAAAGAFVTAKHKKRAQAAAKRKRSAQEDAREVTQTKTK